MSTEDSLPELSASTQNSASPNISSRAEPPVDQSTDGLEEDLAQTEEDTGSSGQATGDQGKEAGSSSQGAAAISSGVDLNSYTRRAWMGSDVTQAEIDWLYRSRRIPEEVFCRIPGKEQEPVPRPGEYVVFASHFERSLGLPVSDFFRHFLDFYELQPHHLPGNSIFYLYSFTAFMEGYAGITPSVDNFSFFYYLRKNSIQDRKLPHPKPFVRCGGCILSPRQGSNFYKLSGLKSIRTWQRSFFYVRNGGPEYFINLPEYVPGPPSMKNWLRNPKNDKESKRVALFIEKNKEETNLCSDDLVRLFLSRRVLPLQRRAHKMSQMSGQKDPTRITTHSLSATDLVLKAKQICQNSLRPNGKYGLLPYSRSNPPPPRNFARIAREEPASYTPNRRFHDDADADPFVKGKHKMGPTHVKRPGNFSTHHPANDSETGDEVVILEVLEHVAPLAAEVGQEFLDTLAQGGQATRARKNKAPASDAGTSEAPPAKRHKKKGSTGPPGRKRRHEMQVATGAPLVLTRSAPGMRPEAFEGAARTSPPPQVSLVPSGAGKSPASPRGGNTSLGRAAPEPPNSRAEEDFTSPPDVEDTGASNIGAGSEDAERTEPPVPPTPKKKKKATASPSKTAPETSALATSSPAKEAPETSSSEKGAPSPPPAPPTGQPAPSPEPTHPEGTILTAQQLTAAVTAATAPPSGSQSLVLHAGRTAIVADEKASAQLGRIVELTRGEVDLGSLREYAEKWNRADLSPATRGLGKDKLPVVDNSGPRSTAQHLSRLKRAVKEFDTAWHDASANVVGTLDLRKQLFEELLWEHRHLSEAFASLQLAHGKCQAALPEASLEDLTGQISALKAEKEKLALEHRKALDAQRQITAELKDKLIQAELQRTRKLKEAQAAGEARLDEALKDFTDATGQLQKELEEETRLLKEARDRNATLASDQAQLYRMVIQTDQLALKLFPNSQPHAHKKVMELRAEHAVSDPDAPWNAYDHLVALHARVSHMKAVDRHLGDVPEVAMQVFKFLWPGEAVPENLTLLAQRLRDAGKRFSEWKRSSARARADAALRVACSWYEGLDLDALHTLLDQAPTDMDPAKTTKRQDHAYRVAQFAGTSTFIPPPADVTDEISEDEEEDDASEDEEEAPEEGKAPQEQAPEAPAVPEAAP
ncbi:hypothetical protein QYE76_046873 [Lolium multiflorum]|uniref:Transposase (putative) gypsy type domain-containing protein n=1 Tax=Lolium multiflorum TaxID=4521 RepID=A0AAD8WZ23_LOLMU|nr:hypothetical protein QYE76_046873 [Lolium multiflorum]